MTITFRIWTGAAIFILALAMLSGLLLWNLQRSADLRDDGIGIGNALNTARSTLSLLKDAETGQRGFIITGEDRYLAPYNQAKAEIAQTIASLRQSVGNDPEAARRLGRLEDLVGQKLSELNETIEVRRSHGFDAARSIVLTDRGKDEMDAIRTMLGEFIDGQERALALAREEEAHRWYMTVITFISAAALAGVTVLIVAIRLVAGIRRALTRLFDGIRWIGEGDLGHRLPEDRSELGRLAAAFNQMAERLRNEQARREEVEARLAKTNSELAQSAADIEARRRLTDLLARMAYRLQGCSSEAEFVEVVGRFGAQIVPDVPAALYILANSRNHLRLAAKWNGLEARMTEFAPGDCWALRRGQPHLIEDVSLDVVCRHVDHEQVTSYLCLPLVAQGETVGLLYFEQRAIDAQASRAANALAENIAPALVNLRLRESLRDQSIRDPMTGLFNRRYLVETLELDLARGERNRTPVGVLMVDADHFKRFNDTFGHDAGDAVLIKIGHLLTAHTRKGDIVCRFGGEEFTLVMPGATLDDARHRAEAICEAAKALHIAHRGRTLGPVTLSIGVAGFPEHGRTGDEIMAAADAALYAAKRDGRDRAAVAEMTEAPPVAAPISAEG